MLDLDHYTDSCFKPLKNWESNLLPSRFTYPFNYTPHPLARDAAHILQEWLAIENFDHDFQQMGKMFGVLVVKNQLGHLGFLSAFSGKLGEKNLIPGFVPPIYDRLTNDGFFLEEEEEITNINNEIKHLEKAPSLRLLKDKFSLAKEQAEQELSKSTLYRKAAKKMRDNKRKEAKLNLSNEEYLIFNQSLEKESKDIFYQHKRLNQTWKTIIADVENNLQNYLVQIDELKQKRKLLSAKLQQRLFDQYQFLNAKGETKAVCSIFDEVIQNLPPAGAGDCAAPKLLQYAYKNGYAPICMAEFWWGKSPRQEVRKHQHFYPACRGKCEPILGHMLKGLLVDPNPNEMKVNNDQALEIIFEDEHLLVINKPYNLLSVPGKVRKTSVYSKIQNMYPNATGPLLVHRLDMATSGLLLIAKDEATYKALQAQFITRTIKKRYVALLEGTIDKNNGVIKLPLRVDLDNRPRQLVCYEHGKPATTQYEVIKHGHHKTLVYFYPHTGRTHQLRVHAAHQDGLNCPIVGDDLYGTTSDRLYLHAEKIEFSHPHTEKRIVLQTPANFSV